MDDKYHPRKLEPEWQRVWEERQVFLARDEDPRPKYYVLEMFPYPSGKLHMGHVRVYTIGDVMARFKRMQGYHVLHPMGFDALGLPAENAAMKDGVHPGVRTRANIDSVRAQLKSVGLSYDWTRELATCDPEYYRWNQWFFLKMLERDLVYRRKSLANWCTGCLTVVANEQVVDGACERCKSAVVQREMPDWAFRITRYADQLLDDLAKLTRWPDRVTTMQRNWIGRSEGAELIFPVLERPVEPLRVFTTRADTIYGATYMVLAPEHPAVSRLTTPAQRAAVQAFVERMSRVDKAVRTDVSTEKEGVWTGAMAENPFTKEAIPIWIANFVLAEYGTGAVMSVPAHDQRDFEFARRYGIEIRVVIQPVEGAPLASATLERAFVEDGVLGDSGPHSGRTSAEARRLIAAAAEAAGQGGPTVNYHLRDWGVSRQRYWGTPIPVIHCEQCGLVPVPYEELPVRLPPEAPITGTGEPPLAKVEAFWKVSCPRCGRAARRDTDTMDTFVDSTWYFLRYLDPHNDRAPFRKALADRWAPVDLYVGGPEHAVMHLLYFRFWTKVLRDLGLLAADEPVDRLLTQGMVVDYSYRCPQHGYRARDGVVGLDDLGRPTKNVPRCSQCQALVKVALEKMSKSKLNGVSPEAVSEEYGSDTLRLFCLFAAPPEKDIEWSDAGVAGCYNFLRRLWTLYRVHQERFPLLVHAPASVDEALLSPALVSFHRLVHRTLQRVTRDIELEVQFNTAIAALMELLNACKALEDMPDPSSGPPAEPAGQARLALLGFTLRSLALMLVPFAPHFAEEVWKALGGGGLACEQPWPRFDPAATVEDRITVVVQVNGKLRASLELPRGVDPAAMEAAARADERVQKWLQGKTVRKVITVPGRLVNIVVG